MRSNEAEAPRGIITELREALDAVPADEPRNYLRQSLQLLAAPAGTGDAIGGPRVRRSPGKGTFPLIVTP
jgi:hypothetical protein